MKDIERIYMLVCICFFIVAPIIFSTITSQKISATDWIYRHTIWIDRYIHGDFSAIWEYPPLFHWMMLPFVYFGVNMVWFQIIFSALNLIIIFWFANKMHNKEAMLLAGMMMATNYAYMQISSALMPQALDLIFFLPAIYFFMKNKYNHTIVILFFGLLMHSTFLIYLAVLVFFSLATKRYKFLPYAIILVLLVSPLYYNYFFNTTKLINGMVFYWDAKAQAEWDVQFYTPLWKFFEMSGAMSWLLLPSVIWELWKKKFKLTEMQLLYAIWLIIFIPMLIGFTYTPKFTIGGGGGIWRTMSFMIIPMMLFEASVLSSMLSDKGVIKKRFKEEFGE